MGRTLITATLLLGAACSSPTGLTGSLLTVLTKDGFLQLENDSDRRTFYFTYERDVAAAINWAPCVDPSLCASLAAGARTAVPYTAIGGYARGKTEAIVWWWHAVPGPADEPVPGRIHSVVVRL